jgi:DNA-binding GntR family transcriptional regulator
MSDRPRGGRRPEDFPEAVRLDEQIVHMLRTMRDPFREPTGLSRNELAALSGADPRRVRYSLNRLRSRGLVVHINKGNEGHGYWAVKTKETETDDQ